MGGILCIGCAGLLPTMGWDGMGWGRGKAGGCVQSEQRGLWLMGAQHQASLVLSWWIGARAVCLEWGRARACCLCTLLSLFPGREG